MEGGRGEGREGRKEREGEGGREHFSVILVGLILFPANQHWGAMCQLHQSFPGAHCEGGQRSSWGAL